MENPLPEAETQAAEPATPAVTWQRILLDVVETVLQAIVLYLIINALVARVQVNGFSMQPTLENGEFVLVNKLAYRWKPPQRGDIIVFHYPYNTDEDYIKRIIGLPGDKIEIYNAKVYVNGHLLKEDYIAAPPRYHGTWEVADTSLFVLGDNRNNSSDSHVWGTLEMRYVIGKAWVIYWPYTHFRVLHHPQLVPDQ